MPDARVNVFKFQGIAMAPCMANVIAENVIAQHNPIGNWVASRIAAMTTGFPHLIDVSSYVAMDAP